MSRIIRKEFATQFVDNKQLYELVLVITPQVDGMLHRHEIKSVSVQKKNTPTLNMVVGGKFNEDEYENDVVAQTRRIQDFKKRDNQGGSRGSYGRERGEQQGDYKEEETESMEGKKKQRSVNKLQE